MFSSLVAHRRSLVNAQLLVIVLLMLAMVAGCASQKPQQTTQNKLYSFWPPAPNEPHVQFLLAMNSTADLSQSKNALDEMLYGKNREYDIIKPYGVAMWNGRIYVADTHSVGIMVWDLRKRQSRIMGASGAGEIKKPIDVSVGPDGTKYVVDGERNAILVFDPEERFVAAFALKDFNPVSVAVYGRELFVCDFAASTVRVLDSSTGRLMRNIGSPITDREAERPENLPIYRRGETPVASPDDGHFSRPLSVRADSKGNIYVVDAFTCRVQKFSREGELLLAFGRIGNQIGEFVRPKHIGISSTGDIYVVDAAFNNVQLFDDQGRVIGFFGVTGDHPGAMNLPAGLCIDEGDLDLFAPFLHPAFDAERLIVVTNQFGPSKVSIYAQGHLKPGKTVADVSGGRTKVNVGLEDANSAATTQPVNIGTPVPPELMTPQAPTTVPARSGSATQ